MSAARAALVAVLVAARDAGWSGPLTAPRWTDMVVPAVLDALGADGSVSTSVVPLVIDALFEPLEMFAPEVLAIGDECPGGADLVVVRDDVLRVSRWEFTDAPHDPGAVLAAIIAADAAFPDHAGVRHTTLWPATGASESVDRRAVEVDVLRRGLSVG